MNDLFTVNEAYNIIKRNTPFADRHELSAMMEGSVADKTRFDSGLLDLLYKQIDQFRRIDFTEISKSKGTLSKLSFFDSIEKTIGFLTKESIEGIYTVQTAWNNIKGRARTFETGFKLSKDFIVLNYNTLVLSCIDAISYLISTVGAIVGSGVKSIKCTTLEALEKFNNLCNSGKFDKAMGAVLKIKDNQNVKEAFETPMVMAFSIGAMLIIIPLIRELIFYFYFLRMKTSNYLDQINKYLEINEVEIKASQSLSPVKRDEIIKKQNMWRSALQTVSDKIRVNQVMAEKQTSKKVEEANKEVNLVSVKGEFSDNSEFDFS